MFLAGHTLGTPEYPVGDALRLFADAGLTAAEVIWQDDYISGLPEGDFAAAEAASVAGEECGVAIHALTPYMADLNSLDGAVRARDIERFKVCIETATRIGARNIRVYAGSFVAGEDDGDAKWNVLVDALKEVAEYAADRGIVACVENHFNTMTVSAKKTAELLTAVDSPGLGALYDQANLAFTHDEEFRQAIDVQAPWIANVHVKDLVFTDPDQQFRAAATHIVSEDERAVRSRIVGDGLLDWPAILRCLYEIGYTGALGLECERRWHAQDLPPALESFASSVQRLTPMLDDLSAEAR